MQVSITDIWQSARGPILRLSPATRLALAALALLACALSQPARLVELAHLAGSVTLWLATCRPPAKLVKATLIWGLLLFAPMFLLSPWIKPSAVLDSLLAVPFSIFLRGLCILVVTCTLPTSMSQTELYQGLRKLHMPRVASMLVLQFVHQTSTLLEETRGIHRALTLRGFSNS